MLLDGRARERLLVEQEHHLGAAAAAEADEVAVHERLLGDLLAVDERAVAGAPIAQDVMLVFASDVGVIARDVAADQLQIVAAAPADGKRRLLERHDTPPEGVGHFEAPKWHGRGQRMHPAANRPANSK